MIDQDQTGHGLLDGDGTGNDAGIMPALGLQGDLLPAGIDRALGLGDGGRWLEGHIEADILAAADASLCPPPMVGHATDGPFLNGHPLGTECRMLLPPADSKKIIQIIFKIMLTTVGSESCLDLRNTDEI